MNSELREMMRFHRYGAMGEYTAYVYYDSIAKIWKVYLTISICNPRYIPQSEIENKTMNQQEFNKIFPAMIGYAEKRIEALTSYKYKFTLTQGKIKKALTFWEAYNLINRSYPESSNRIFLDTINRAPTCMPVIDGAICVEEIGD